MRIKLLLLKLIRLFSFSEIFFFNALSLPNCSFYSSFNCSLLGYITYLGQISNTLIVARRNDFRLF